MTEPLCEDELVSARRSADDLRGVDDAAWPKIEELIRAAPIAVRVLDAAAARRDVALEVLKVSVASFLGGVVGGCGALVVDHGWLRMLGAGADRLPGVHEVNVLRSESPPLLTVAWDVLGGQFAINGGGLAAELGEVCYWAPDTLDWMGLGHGYGAFIAWALSDRLAEFYSSLRWLGWERDTEALALDEGLSVYPPPFTVEGRDVGSASRRPVPLAELHEFLADAARQLTDVPDGSAFKLNVRE